MLNAQKIGPVSLAIRTIELQNYNFSKKLILSIPIPFALYNGRTYLAFPPVCEIYSFKLLVYLHLKLYKEELYVVDKIPIVLCTDDMEMIFK